MNFKNCLIICTLIAIVNLVNSNMLGDVSISPSRYFFKKRLISPSIRPYLNEQTLVTKLERTRSSLNLTTPIPSTAKSNEFDDETKYKKEFSKKPISENYGLYSPDSSRYDPFNAHRQASPKYVAKIDNPFFLDDSSRYNRTRFYPSRRNQTRNRATTTSTTAKLEHEFDVITHTPIESEDDSRLNYLKETSNYTKLNQLNLNRTYYRVRVVDLPNYSKINNEIYPIVKFMNQYKCDLNATTCGLVNDAQLKDMFYLEQIQNVFKRTRCLIADTNRARRANMYGARLITQYFHTFGLTNACLELRYFANGPGIRRMEIAQQDEQTKVIWSLEENYEFSVELNFNQFKTIKIPIDLKPSEPRFFITVNLDPSKTGRIGMLGFSFTYSKCDEF